MKWFWDAPTAPPDDPEVENQIRSELRPGGKPATAMMSLGIQDSWLAIELTNEVFRNWEDRLCALEAKR